MWIRRNEKVKRRWMDCVKDGLQQKKNTCYDDPNVEKDGDDEEDVVDR